MTVRTIIRIVALFSLVIFPSAGARAKPLIETINGEQPIRLKAAQVSGDIRGSVAETTVRLVVFNPNGRPLEGRLQFPLLPGQQITAFALDIDGVMRAAVPVEKTKGRQIIEEVERRGADPALLENAGGNNFSLKIFPVPPLGTRTVELKYAEALDRVADGWAYRLPLAYGDDAFDLDLTLRTDVRPKVTGLVGNLAFQPVKGGFAATAVKPRFRPGATIDLLMAAPSAPKTFVHEREGETYFVAEIPVANKAVPRQRPLLTTIELLWDSSGSGANRQHAAELAALDRYFQAVGAAKVKLTRLRDRPETTEDFQVSSGEWGDLRRALETTVYDGASALAAWTPHAETDEYLLVSDGMSNYGPAAFPALPAHARLFALNSALSADTDALSALAESTGGRLVPIDPANPGALAEALLFEGPAVRNLRAEGADALLVDANQMRQGILRVVGKLMAPAATLRFTLVQGGQRREVTVPVAAGAAVHPAASSLWARLKLRGLQVNYEDHRGEIRRLGETFGIATRETSLLVLERAEDYARYDVTPPPELQAAVASLRERRGQLASEQRAKQIESIVAQFAQKVAWWEKEYDKSDPQVEKKPEPERGESWASSGAAQGSVSNEVAAMAGMAHAPAPAAMRAGAASPAAGVSAAPRPAAAAEPVAAAPGRDIGVAVKKWQSNAPYAARMRERPAEEVYAVYLDEKPSYANSPAFFLDAADILMEKGLPELALRVLSNLMEMDLDNRQVLRLLGTRLLQAGAPQLAVPVFEKVLRLAGDEPQSYRDLGLAYAATGEFQKAVDRLYEVVTRPWSSRFAEIELIALAEMNAIIARAPEPLNLDAMDPRLLRNLPLDIRVVMTWDANDADMDLWVTDPNGEKCFFQHRFTRQGGRNSIDYTAGYGPEEFSLRKAKPGRYKIEANFYGSRQQLVAGATTVSVRLTTAFATPEAKDTDTWLRLKSRAETALIGEFEVK